MLAKAITAVGLAASLALAPTGPASASPGSEPPTEKLSIELVTVNGSGCPRGTVAVSISPDNAKLVVIYSDYAAQLGVGTRPTDFRKNCQLSLLLHHPKEYTYGIIGTRPRGYASLPAGAYGTVRAGHYFQGSSVTGMVSHRLDGPMDDSWYFEDDLAIEPSLEACGEQRLLNINTELRVNAGTSDPKTTTSYLVMDNLDIVGGTAYNLAWQRCPSS